LVRDGILVLVRLCFITSTPLNVVQGSGTFVGIDLLARTLRSLGVEVDVLTPSMRFPIYTVQRLIFNSTLRRRMAKPYDAIVGFDMDGYTIAESASCLHVASIKGVIADEMRFESGLTWATMRIQEACERKHVQRAARVFATSEYSAAKIEEYYGPAKPPVIVPELIDLEGWRRLDERCRPRDTQGKFVVLSVCRFYRRKRLEMLLGAAERLRDRMPDLQVRIIGGGPERDRLRRLWRQKGLEPTVVWREDISQEELAAEYMGCDLFCLPSVQEGFGIVFLEAMAHGKPIVACRAGATPEVVQQGWLTRPDDPAELADAIVGLYQQESRRRELGLAGLRRVKQFECGVVARQFLRELERAGQGNMEGSPNTLKGQSA
jgi:glycosyltransferase involved in cell wall biosynthesis